MTQSEGHECPEGMFPGSHVHKLLVFRVSGDAQDAKMSLRGWKGSRIPRQVSVHRRGLRPHQEAQSGTSWKGRWGQPVCGEGRGEGGAVLGSLPWQCPFLTMM